LSLERLGEQAVVQFDKERIAEKREFSVVAHRLCQQKKVSKVYGKGAGISAGLRLA
jgi:hypothetical protein